MRPLRRKLARDLRAHAGEALTIGVIVALGIASLAGFLGVYRDMTRSRDRYYRARAFHDFQVTLRRMPVGALREVRALPGVERAEGRISRFLPMVLPGEPRRLATRLVSLPEVGTPQVNDLRLVAGRWPSGGGAPEVLVSRDFAEARGVGPGDRVALLAEGVRREVVVAGVAMSPEFVFIIPEGAGIVPDPRRFAVTWARRTYAERIFDMTGAVDDVVGHVARGSDPGVVAAAVERRLARFGVYTAEAREFQRSHAVLRDELAQLLNHARFVPTIFLAASVLVLHLVLGRLVASQRRAIGTLKALGVSTGTIALHYAAFGAAVAVAGAVVGGAGGHALQRVLLRVYTRFYHLPLEPPALYPDLLLGGLALALGTAMLGVGTALRAVLALGPAEAMRAAPPETRAGAVVPRLAALPFLWRVAMRNAVRHPFRSGVGILGVALGAGLMISVGFLREGMGAMAAFRFRVIQRQDLEVRLREGAGPGARLEVARIPGVTRVEESYVHAFELRAGRRERRVLVKGVPAGAFLRRPRLRSHAAVPVPPAGLLLSAKLAEVLGVRAGGSVEARSLRTAGPPRRVLVAATYPSNVGMDAFADRRWLGRLVGEPRAASRLDVAVEARSLALEEALAARPDVLKVVWREDKIASFEEKVLGTLEVATHVMIWFAGALACGMILNGALVSLAERRGELAVLRAQGFTRREVADLLLYEHAVLGAAGMLLGVPLGRLFATWTHAGFDTELYRLPWVFSAPNVAGALLWSVAFLVAAHLVLRRMVRGDWRGALAVRE